MNFGFDGLEFGIAGIYRQLAIFREGGCEAICEGHSMLRFESAGLFGKVFQAATKSATFKLHNYAILDDVSPLEFSGSVRGGVSPVPVVEARAN